MQENNSQNKEKILAVCTYATKNYLHAFLQCIRSISAAVAHYETGHFIYSCDESKECEKAVEIIKNELPENWKIHTIKHKIPDDTSENYRTEAQKRISILQNSAFSFARKVKADLCWSVESDILVPPNALKNLEWVLSNPDGHYQTAALTYANAELLGGFSNKNHWICEDYLPHERKLKPHIKLVLEEIEKRLKNLFEIKSNLIKEQKNKELALNEEKIIKEQKRRARIDKYIRRCPPDGKNIWEIISKYGWRPRGWCSSAYPALARYSVVPVGWHGLGCILLNHNALQHATFHGYGPECSTTQDIFLFQKRWIPNGIYCGMSTYEMCDHVKPEIKDGKRTGKYIHYIAYFEDDPNYPNHLRVRQKEWCPL